MRVSLRFIFLIPLAATVLLSGCKVKRVTQKSPLLPVSENFLLDQLTQSSFDFESLNGKLSVSASSPSQNGSFKVNLRIKSGNTIWMSITPALGIEAARLTIEPDTLKFIDKIKNQYYVGGYDFLDSLFRYSLEYKSLENILVGNPIEITPDEKYSSSVESLNYVIQTKVRRKLRKAFNLNKWPANIDSLYIDAESTKARQLGKAVDKFDEDDLIIKRYYLRPDNFKVERTIIEDITYKRTIYIKYNDYRELDGQEFPNSIEIEIRTPKETSRFELNYSRLRIDEPQSYPFRIPSKYEPIE